MFYRSLLFVGGMMMLLIGGRVVWGGGNTAPVGVADSYETAEGVHLLVTAPGVLENDEDVDGDGLTAILANNVSTGTLILDSDGSFIYNPPVGFTGTVTFSYRADDGYVGNVGVFEEGGGVLSEGRSDDVLLFDMDGDGDSDALFISSKRESEVWFNDGEGEFVNSGQMLGMGTHGAWGDFDGDGDGDVVVAPGGRVWLNDGDGLFSDSEQHLVASNARGPVVVADLSGDGIVDILMTMFDGPDRYWVNDGAGVFTLSEQMLDPNSGEGVDVGDVDNDGDNDVVVTNYGAASYVWFNNGMGVFTETLTIPGGGRQGVALGDLDGDDDLDAFVLTPVDNRVWLNDGMGVFTDTGQMLGSGLSVDVRLVDVDGDDDLDAWVANLFGQANKVWLNDGSGQFVDSGQALGERSSSGVAVADIDGDGDMDAVVANLEMDVTWLNGGGVHLSEETMVTIVVRDEWRVYLPMAVGP